VDLVLEALLEHLGVCVCVYVGCAGEVGLKVVGTTKPLSNPRRQHAPASPSSADDAPTPIITKAPPPRPAAKPAAHTAHLHDQRQRLLRDQRGDLRVAGVVEELERAADGPRGGVADVGVGVLGGLGGRWGRGCWGWGWWEASV